MNIFKTRLAQLRASMSNNNIDAYIIINTDPHIGEYIPGHWKIVQWLTGFTGSEATVIIAKKTAGLWTDSRYFIQAEEQLAGTGISLRKMNIPSAPGWSEWLGDKIKSGSRIGVDGRIFSLKNLDDLQKNIVDKNVIIDFESDLISDLWTGRPSLPDSIAYDHNISFSGKERSTKIDEVRDHMEKINADFHLLTSLDDIMWLLNIRGKDLEYSPLLISFALVGMDQVLFFTDEKKIALKLAFEFDKCGITILPYEAVSEVLSRLKKGSSLLLTPETTNAMLINSIPENVRIIRDISIPTSMKAIKNGTEIENLRRVMVKDGVALTKFLYWLERGKGTVRVSESRASEELLKFRLQQSDCTGESFSTISAFNSHGAIVHYNTSDSSDSFIEPDGIYLVDSGGQYLDGTTDITRTICIGSPTPDQKRDFTLVLKGLISLATAKFPTGTRGYQLDILARKALWDNGLNYGHGTGHGVGSFLNVHEGPYSISPSATAEKKSPLLPGLVFSDEPAIYREGKYGIRLENLILVIDEDTGESGQFLKFETLSLCYFDKTLIDRSLLEQFEIRWLNQYHSTVYERLSSLLTEEEVSWLKDKTGEI
jgi:Xaa-Pro aminopeptidase